MAKRDSTSVRQSKQEQSADSSHQSRKRKNQEPEDQPSKKRSKQQFSYLKPQIRTISEEVVKSEWKSLPKPAQQQVRDIFLATKRNTLNRVAEGPRRREAEFVVNDVLRRLEKQLPRMPFPASTKAAQLDLEDILESARLLEAEKTPLNDSVKLLQEEIEREEGRIDQKRAELARLEKDVKIANKTRKQRAAKTHPLLAEDDKKASTFDDAESIGLIASSAQPDGSFDDADEELAPLLSQLRSHVDSIRTNAEQVANIDDEMLRTRAVLSSLLPQDIT